MANEFRKVVRDNRFYPNLDLLITMFTDTLAGTAPVRVYEDGWMFFEWKWAMFAHYTGTNFLDHTDSVVQEGSPPANVTLTAGGPEKTDVLFREFGNFNEGNRVPFLIPFGHLFSLPHFNDADWLEKGNYPPDKAVTVLPTPPDSGNFVRAFVFLHAANSPTFDQTFPTWENDNTQRNMRFFTMVQAITFNSATVQGRIQDVISSATFFRQFFRFNPWRDSAGNKPAYTDPNNGGAPIRL